MWLKKLLMPASLVAVWLILNTSVSPGQWALGILVAMLLVWAAKTLRPLHAHPKKILVCLKLAGVVIGDIVRSNIAVSRIIWRPDREMVSGFMSIPLSLRDPHGQAILACILTYTPGSVWVELNGEGDTLLLHVLDLKDESFWVDLVQNRYERQLKEIFE